MRIWGRALTAPPLVPKVTSTANARGPSWKRQASCADFAFRASDLAGTKKMLGEKGIPFEGRPQTGGERYQIFCKDPDGVGVEMNFDLAAERAAGTDDGL